MLLTIRWPACSSDDDATLVVADARCCAAGAGGWRDHDPRPRRPQLRLVDIARLVPHRCRGRARDPCVWSADSRSPAATAGSWAARPTVADGIRQAVHDRVSRGVDVIKIMVTGGNMTPTLGPHESQYTIDELVAAVTAAHAAGLPIAAHAHGGQGIADAMAAGVDSIEHCTFFTADGVEADPEVIAELGRRQAVVSITGGTLPGTTPPFPAIAKRREAIMANHAALHRAGARIVCGTDAGVGPNKPHDVLRYGVSSFPAIGMTNAEALRANTSVAAAACGVDRPQRHDLDRQGRRPPRRRRRSTRRHQLYRAGPRRLRQRQPHSPHSARRLVAPITADLHNRKVPDCDGRPSERPIRLARARSIPDGGTRGRCRVIRPSRRSVFRGRGWAACRDGGVLSGRVSRSRGRWRADR